MTNDEPLIPKHGGYRNLKSFKIARLIFDVTVHFCDRYIDKKSRTHDQMVQAARSGVQNIAEGSKVSGTSKKMEMKLTQVARASLEELVLDYEDFLRQNNYVQWKPDNPEALKVRNLAGREAAEGTIYQPWIESSDPAIVANTIICPIHKANYLLDRQIAALEKLFIEEGGYTESLAQARIQYRHKKGAPAADNLPCPKCHRKMVLRKAYRGKNAGKKFLGCTGYPECRGTRDFKERGESD